ncbi:protein-disulfide reductase DsbD domain-containing protein [Sediminibacterium sp.]|uniref:protein-disulfide reductase DsbD domain-containing protein n=1 Tax=Sediminibacterium sp. TaxID=1917865 RepID=UPI002737708F|nr:protein-disulfide reductase DsbD domain-containing protein [Sediminibacterium sp.]MDP3567522.1 protein-disulfide reductase DsbD family protein [Sediminibacterium sp.]
MKILLTICIGLFSFLNSHSQEKPIKWDVSYTPVSATEGEIIIKAVIEKGWHTYSQQANNAVPFPTLISYKESTQYQLIGKTEEKNTHEEFDEVLKAKLLVFSNKAEFKQKVKLNTKSPQTILLKVEYILCDNKKCLPPTTIDLEIKTQ